MSRHSYARMVARGKAWPLCSVLHTRTCARVALRNSSGRLIPANCISPTFSTGVGNGPGRRIDWAMRSKGLHYKWVGRASARVGRSNTAFAHDTLHDVGIQPKSDRLLEERDHERV